MTSARGHWMFQSSCTGMQVGIVNKKYRIGARKVKVTGEKEIQYVSSESSVAEGIVEQHGTQDCDCYRMVQLNEIIYLYGKVDV